MCSEFIAKKVVVNGIDYEELGLYLALNLDGEELVRLGIGNVCPTRTHHARKPEITGSGIKVKKTDRFEPWTKTRIQPNQQQKETMIKEALRIAITVVMKNHTYEFNQEIRRQVEGGAIGMDLTGTVAKIYMKWWDRQLTNKVNAIGLQIELYERYVDDINIGMKAVEVGARYQGGEVIITEESRTEDIDVPAGLRIIRIIEAVGNSIHPSIQLEIDVPSNYEDGRLPILDLKVWVGEVATGDGVKRKIFHEHYVKEVASKYVIHRAAAMSLQSKRRIMTQMCLRVLLNNSEYLVWAEKKSKVEFFMMRMQASGYGERFRYEVLRSAIHAYGEIKNDDDRPLYRGKGRNTPQRRKENKERKKNWFRRGNYESVMFVPATPDSELKRRIQDEIDVTNVKVKVIERMGTKIKRMLQKNNPFKRRQCNDDLCFVCSTTKRGRCRTTGVTYAVDCKGDCGENVYFGETHANGYTRGMEHLNDYRYKRADSVMWKHCVKKHDGEEQEFEMRIIDYVRGDPTKRQILEAICQRNSRRQKNP